MNALYKFLIHRLVAWFANLNADQFAEVRSKVTGQVGRLTSSENKAAVVKDFIRSLIPIASAWVVNLVLELAVAWVKKQNPEA